MLSVRPVDVLADYPKLKAWWEARSFPPAIEEFLPPTGIMAQVSGQDVCAGFLFIADGKLGCIANLVSDPRANKGARSAAFDLVMESLIEIGKQRGLKLLSCSTNIPSVMRRFEGHGFTKTDEHVASFGRIL